MKSASTAAILAATMIISLVSCKKEALQTTYNNQETKIDTYITSLTTKDPDLRVVHNNGSHRVVLTEGDGEDLGAKGRVALYYAGYTFANGISNSNLFTTNHEDTATAAKWTTTGGDFGLKTIDLGRDDLLDGLRNGLEGVKAGEVCYIIFSGKYAYGNHAMGTIPANSALAFQVWVESISND